ncbi:hypothetical protein PIIN_08688 [Serendipita indica DSM 11827]|uniref:C3H1-type domain-containing protein n=2 Tax=Serendipita indica (strain DSM 11827) TaxID=1109443 RepID=G4TTT4_SERID|nr:hypothetical protein PIIN_08688 [Serendipita indica DSM 11827]
MLTAQDSETVQRHPEPAIRPAAEDEHNISSPILQAILNHKNIPTSAAQPSITCTTMPGGDGYVTSPTVVATSAELPARRSGITPVSLTQTSDTGMAQNDEPGVKPQYVHRASSSEDQENLISEDEEEVEFVLEATPAPSDKDGATSERPSRPGSVAGTPGRNRIVAGQSPSLVARSNLGISEEGERPSNEHFGNGITCRYYNKSRCAKGHECPYSHAPDLCSLRSHPEGRNVCLYFIHNNKCRFAEPQCNYSHKKGDLLPWDDEEIERQLEFKLGIRKDALRAATTAKKTMKQDKSRAAMAYEERKKAQDQAKILAKPVQQAATVPINSTDKQSKPRNRSSSGVSLGKNSNTSQGSKAKDSALANQRAEINPVAPTRFDEGNTVPSQGTSVPLSGGVSLGTSSKTKTTYPVAELLKISASSSPDLANRMRAGATKSNSEPSSVGLGVTSTSGSHATSSSVSERTSSLLATESSQSMSEQSPPTTNYKRKPNKRKYAPPYTIGANSYPRWDLPQTLDRLQLLRFGQLRWDSGGNGLGDQSLETLRALATIQMGLRAPPTSLSPAPHFDALRSIDPAVMGYYPVPSLNYGNALDQAALEQQLQLDYFARYGVPNRGYP